MKTCVFFMFSARPASQRTSHFLTTALRKQVPDPDSYFRVQNHKIVHNLFPKWSPRGSPTPPKITKSQSLDPKVSQEVSLWLPGSPQWMPKVLKWSPWVLKINALGIKTILSSRHPLKSCLLSRSAVVQLLVDRGGRRQGAKPLNAPRQGSALPLEACQTPAALCLKSCQRSARKKKKRLA